MIQFERLVGEVTSHLATRFLRVSREGEASRFLPVKDPAELEARRPEIEAVAKARGIFHMTKSPRPLLALLVTLALLSGAIGADAQTPISRPGPLPALGRSVASSDDTTALVLNPANLAFMPGAELRWSSIYLDENNSVPWQGHAIALGFPLPLVPLATGLRFDMVDPPAGAAAVAPYPPAGSLTRDRFATDNYQWLTWGLALGSSDTASLGISYQHSYSRVPEADSFSGWTAGSAGVRSTRSACPGWRATSTRPRSSGGTRLDPSFDMALALRPFGTRTAELGLEARYIDTRPGVWVPRATLGIDIPPIGRLRGDFQMSNPGRGSRAWVASAALAVYLNTPAGSMEAAGGAVTGNGLGHKNSYGVQTDFAFKGFREPAGPEVPRYAIRIRIENTPGTREHVALLRKLWSIADDEPGIDAVVFELRTAPASSLAHIQELRDAIFHLRQKGKRVLCHLEDAPGSALYMCSAANRILMNPAGGLRFAGLRTQRLYFAGLLKKLGIRADFVRIGKHKSAPEEFTRESATPTARADSIDLLQQYERQFMEGVSAGRHIPVDKLRERIAKGPFIASEAKAAGLIDGYAFDDQIDDAVSRLVGRKTLVIDDQRARRAPERFGNVQRVALVYVDGDMIDGRNRTIPLIGTRLAGSYTIADTLKQVREDPSVGAVVLRIESPGGSAMAADVMWRQIQITAAVKPVVVSMGTYAASGGYYIAAPATRIFANPLSITGSIGIFYGKADIAQLLKKIGVNVETYKTAPRADAESIFRPFTPGERKELGHKVAQFYDTFLSRVATGRGMTKQAVDKVARGRVWTGEQAQSRGLVDQLGGLRQALAYARAKAGLPAETPIEELPPPNTTLIGKLLGIEGIHASAASAAAQALPPQLFQLFQALGPVRGLPARPATGAHGAHADRAMSDADQPLLLCDGARIDASGALLLESLTCVGRGNHVGLVGDWAPLFSLLGGEAELGAGRLELDGVEASRAVALGVVGLARYQPGLPPGWTASPLSDRERAPARPLARREPPRRPRRARAAAASPSSAPHPAAARPGRAPRALIAHATLGAPRVLALEAPLAGLDDAAQARLVPLIDRAAAGRKLLWSAASAAPVGAERGLLDSMSEVLVLEAGSLVAEGPPGHALSPGTRYLVTVARDAGELAARLEAGGLGVRPARDGGQARLVVGSRRRRDAEHRARSRAGARDSGAGAGAAGRNAAQGGDMSEERRALPQARRIVVKIGSRALAGGSDLPERVAAEIATLSQSKRSFVLVSSGAIAIGCERLGYRSRPREMARLQAAAAAGQSVLMHRYEQAFAAQSGTVAQVLLTHADLADPAAREQRARRPRRAARCRRRAHRQRERHGRDRRDPLRRQRSARRHGRRRWSALICSCCSPMSTACSIAAGGASP